MALVKIDVEVDADRARADLQKLEKDTETSTGNMARSWKTAGTAIKAAMAATAVVAVANFGMDALKAGESARLGAAKAKTAFGGMTDSVARWSGEVNKRFGVSNDAILSLAGNVGTMARAQGLGEDAAADFSQRLVMLGGNLDLVNDSTGSVGEAVDALGAGLRGEFDSMEKLGLSIKQSDVNARLAAKGQAELTGAALKTASATAFLELAEESAQGQMKSLNEETVKQKIKQNEVNATYEEAKTEIGKYLSEGLGKVALWIVNTGIPTMKEWGKKVGEIASDIKAAFKDIWDKVKTIWNTVGSPVFEAIKWGLALVVGKVIWAKERIKTAVELGIGFFGALRNSVGWVIDRVQDLLEKLQALKDFFSPGGGRVTGGRISPNEGIDWTPGFDLPNWAVGTRRVPGPLGAGMLAVVHGGEEIRRNGQTDGSGGGNVYNLTVNAGMGADPDELGAAIVAAIERYERRNGRQAIGGAA